MVPMAACEAKDAATARPPPLPPPSEKTRSLSTLAKFKAAQDLKIQTENLVKPSTTKQQHVATTHSNQSNASSTASSSSSSTCSSSSSNAVTPQTPAVPTSTGKKRRRRTAAQIDRKYACNYPGCNKAYGSEGSLTQHQRLKHRQQPNDPVLTAAHSGQLGNLFIPLHRAPAPRALASANTIYNRTSTSSSAAASRTVNIRPATMEGMISPLPFDASDAATAALSSCLNPFQDASRSESRQNLRARSNSMPVSFTSSATICPVPTSGASVLPRPQSTRRSRASTTPRASKAAASARRTKSRSKSESLLEAEPLATLEEVHPHRSFHEDCFSDHAETRRRPNSLQDHPTLHHSSSDTSSASSRTSGPSVKLEAHTTNTPTATPHPFHWPPATSTPVSTTEQAIDSDILSVLADCDASDMMNAVETSSTCSSASYLQAFASDEQDVLMTNMGIDGFKLTDDASSATTLEKLDTQLGFAIKEETTWPTYEDTLYLSNHMEKMSVVTPTGAAAAIAASLDPATTFSCELMTSTQPNHHMADLGSIAIESYAVKELPDVNGESMDICETSAYTTTGLSWPADGAAAAAPCFGSATELDVALYMEDDDCMATASVQPWANLSMTMNSLYPDYAVNPLPKKPSSSQVPSASSSTFLSDAMLFCEANEFGVDDTRLSSPMI